MKIFQRLTVITILAASALATAGCSGNGNPTSPTASAPAPASAQATDSGAPSQKEVPSAAPAVALPAGIIAKGVANDGKGTYLQTSIADTDPAMKYNPVITDDAAKAHYSAADLAEAQKVIVKFIAEEGIDSTLNGGNKDIDGWYAAHKEQILPANQQILLGDLKAGKAVLATETWMASKPGYSYVHGDNTPRVIDRTITPTQLYFVESGSLQGVMLDTKVAYSMKVVGGTHTGIQKTTGEVSFAVAKDAADGGKWKIAGYDTNYHTTEG